MDTPKTVKVSDLSGPALDWAVAKCEGVSVEIHSAEGITARRLLVMSLEEAATLPPPQPYLVIPGKCAAQFSSDWSLAGPIIEREEISVEYGRADYKSNWIAYKLGLPYEDNPEGGPTPLVAAMRCYVASRLGDTVKIPEELL